MKFWSQMNSDNKLGKRIVEFWRREKRKDGIGEESVPNKFNSYGNFRDIHCDDE